MMKNWAKILPLEKGLIEGGWKVQYQYTMTPVEILKKARGLTLEFDGPSQMYEAFNRVYEYGYDIGYDEGYDEGKSLMQDRIKNIQGLGE